jgi:DNA-binding IclR family transcriptional regulator
MPAQPNQSLIDGLLVLQELVAAPHPVGSREMAQRVGLEHTRVNRLLGTLALLGIAEQTPDRKYRPGPGVHVLAAQSLQGSPLLATALPHLESLRANDPNLTVALGVRWRQYVCFLYHARPGMRLDEAIGTHILESVAHSSIGVLMLAQSSEDLAETLTLAEEAVRQDRTMPEPPLPEAVTAAREKGYARHHYRTGEISLAVPVGRPPIAGIALSGKMTEEEISTMVERLRGVAARIEADMKTPVRRR